MKYKGKIDGDLTLNPGDDISKVTSIGGSVAVSEGATLQADALTSIGGSVYVRPNATLQADALTSIGGSVDVSEGATLQADALTSIGGSVDVSKGATLQADALTSIGGYELPDKATCQARLLAVAKAAIADPANLNMKKWHNESRRCGSAHCIAGWAVHLEGDAGYDLEDKVNQPMAGNVLLGLEASHLFFLENDDARSALNRVIEGKPPLERLAK